MKVESGNITRALPTPKQRIVLPRWIGSQRWLYNENLKARQNYYQIFGKTLTYYEQAAALKVLKYLNPWLKELPAQVHQQTLLHLDNSYHRFLTGISKFPQKKKKFSNEAKIHIPQFFRVERLSKNYGQVHLPKIDEPLRFYWTQKIPKKPKSCIISMKNGQIFLSFPGTHYTNKVAPSGTSCGIDVGVNVSVATSKPIDGKRLHDIRTQDLKNLEIKIADYQRKQSAKIKGSSRWQKLQKLINNLYIKASSIRQDEHHKLTTKIAKNHSNLFREDLDVQGMTENAGGTVENPGKDVAKKTGLNRAIIRQGWGMHFRMLNYKNSWYSHGMSYKNPPYYSSQKCNECKFIHEDNRKKGTIFFHCLKCGYKVHADLNASDNHEEDGLASCIAKDGWTQPTRNPDSTKKRWTKRLNKKKTKVVALSEPQNLPLKEQGGDSSKNDETASSIFALSGNPPPSGGGGSQF